MRTPSLPPVLVLGEGNTALGALRSFGRRGIDCYVAPPASDMVRRSRWYRPWPGADRLAGSGPDLAGLLEAGGVDRAVLMPCSDWWLTAVSDLPPVLASRFPSSLPPRPAIDAVANKGNFLDQLARLQLPTPYTVRLRDSRDLAGIPDDVLSRAFLKPADSFAFQARFGCKAYRFASRDEAARLVDTVAAAGLEIMLQEYVPGPPTAHYFVDGFVDRSGALQAVFGRQRLRMWPPDFGNSSALRSVPRAEVAAAVATIETFLASVSYRGIFSAEFKQDPRDGVFKIIEVNARVWKFVDFAAGCGVDVCHMAYLDALGMAAGPVSSYSVDACCVDVYFDRRPCLALYRRNELTMAAWAGFWLKARPVTFSWDDPMPGVASWFSLAARLR